MYYLCWPKTKRNTSANLPLDSLLSYIWALFVWITQLPCRPTHGFSFERSNTLSYCCCACYYFSPSPVSAWDVEVILHSMPNWVLWIFILSREVFIFSCLKLDVLELEWHSLDTCIWVFLFIRLWIKSWQRHCLSDAKTIRWLEVFTEKVLPPVTDSILNNHCVLIKQRAKIHGTRMLDIGTHS